MHRSVSHDDLPPQGCEDEASLTNSFLSTGSRHDLFFRQASLQRMAATDDALLTGSTKRRSFRDLSEKSVRGSIHESPHSANCSSHQTSRRRHRIYDDPAVVQGYVNVPLMEQTILPRGGTSLDTVVGRIQFGIPPETIKDSMRLGIEVPRMYIVPPERFCREMGPSLGINLAEFEFPAYFNFFVRQKRCILVVDSEEAERNIRNVFEETLLGPQSFRDDETKKAYEESDFDPGFPIDRRPDFYQEFKYFRILDHSRPIESELSTDKLLEFCHFVPPPPLDLKQSLSNNSMIGVPPLPDVNTVCDGDIELLEGFNSSLPSFCDSVLTLAASNTPIGRLGTISGHRTSLAVAQSPLELDWARQGKAGDTASFAGSDVSDKASHGEEARRGSLESTESWTLGSRYYIGNSSRTLDDDTAAEHSWLYSKVKWLGEVATLWPQNATLEQVKNRSLERVEIFRMPGGAEYIVHNVNEHNVIVGKARVDGSINVPDEIAVEGFLAAAEGGSNMLIETEIEHMIVPRAAAVLPTFHPPSFGVTVLGNSHGFDKNGSTSGYVLWINGRGIMIDPPPYSSATLEREGIRPQMVIGVIITHCHADHDAGAFQKLLTGSRVAVITTHTIYQSFIRKYAALSGMKPSLLKHSHRHRPAIIGQPLRFQGALFHFTYSLHTIPCIGFKVEWRGKSVVFTGDHLNSPPVISDLVKKGVLSPGRADDLRNLTAQDCDVLLHEAGAPPIHTPLSVLESLAEEIKQRLLVVHTSALPPGSTLRVAQTGTTGTIRLDELIPERRKQDAALSVSIKTHRPIDCVSTGFDTSSLDDGGMQSLSVAGDFVVPTMDNVQAALAASGDAACAPPLVFVRPTDVSDAWFILNLLSNVPFIPCLSFGHTMEVLEIASVHTFSKGELVVSGDRRPRLLCVIWEGTCVERPSGTTNDALRSELGRLWHAGDWDGPVALQPESTHHAIEQQDIMAISEQGVKAIFIQMADLYKILQRGSALYQRYRGLQASSTLTNAIQPESFGESRDLLDLYKEKSDPAGVRLAEALGALDYNSLFRKMSALQRRSLESIAEGVKIFGPEDSIWQVGSPSDCAYLLVSGEATFGRSKYSPQTFVQGTHRRRKSSKVSVVEMSNGDHVEIDRQLKTSPDGEYGRLEALLQRRERAQAGEYIGRTTEKRRQDTFDGLSNKILTQLYASHKVIPGLVFGRGCFLCDTSKMVSGYLVSDSADVAGNAESNLHSSTMIAGLEGCVAVCFPKANIMQLLDSNPGLLLSLLGTQVVV